MSSSDITALRKQGRSAEALEMARSEYKKDSADIWFLRAYAWSLYDHVKHVNEAYDAKEMTKDIATESMTTFMREFVKIAHGLRGDSTFTQMIHQAVKASKYWNNFLKFAKWVANDDFQGVDDEIFTNDQGEKTDSLKVKLLRAIARETVTRSEMTKDDPQLLIWGVKILDEALEDNPDDLWLNYHRCKLHHANNETNSAIKRLAYVMRRKSRDAWPWGMLGEILSHTRPDDAITCFAYATQLAREEKELAKIRINLANILAHMSRFNEAARQVELAQEYRQKSGFAVPQELKLLMTSDWYRVTISNQTMVDVPNAESAARALMQELRRYDLKYTVGVVDHINEVKRLTFVATGVDTGITLPHHKFPDASVLIPGSLVEVGFGTMNGPPHDWRHTEVTEIEGLCQTFSGRMVRKDGKDFAFIRSTQGDIYVPETIAKKYEHGTTHQVSCLAIKRTNKQGKTGWRAVTVTSDLFGNKPIADAK